MSKKSYSFYPGCSSQKAASASNYMTSVNSMCETLDIELNEIPDWNCCSASIGYAGGGELPRLALSARNMALSEQAHPDQDIVATCAACWLATKETQERLHDDEKLMAETNEALAAAGEWEGAVDLFRGSFLEGFSLPDSAPFEDWARGVRQELERRRGRPGAVDAPAAAP